ncbi:hypothetical protein Q8F55_001916 [Vanrija albida]|uniref:3'-5' exonuclease domain-containing protein n=1 Tax=Vanrija albida TaxID=181172 RepID=A0ABR3Q9E7_9TREE
MSTPLPNAPATILARHTLRTGAKVPPARNLGAELAELTEEWTGPAVFVERSGSGTASSPISVASTPSPPRPRTAPAPAPATPSRLRVVPRYSPLAGTALTPPRREPPRPLHPFFRGRAAPPPRQPRFVASYASTSESSQSSSSQWSQSSQGTPSPSALVEITDEMVRLALAPRRVAPVGRASVAEKAAAAPRAPRAVALAKATEQKADQAKPAPDAAADAAPAPAPAPAPDDLPTFSVKSPIPGHFTRAPSIVYTSDASEADDLVACLRGDVFGFDMEWPMPGVGPTKTKTLKDGTQRTYREGKFDPKTRRYTWPQGRTAVVQLADTHTVVVYRIPEGRRPGPGLAAFLADPARRKVGVNIRNDGNKFARDFPSLARPGGLVELSAIARRLDPRGTYPGHSLVALARLARRYLARELDKDPAVRSGAWDGALGQEQVEYAANDAYAALLIFRAMERRAAEEGVGMDGELPAPPQRIKEKDAALAPAKAAALGLFAAGDDVPAVAGALGIKETTAMWYVAEAAVAAGLDSVDAGVRRRLMALITPDSGLARRWGELLPDLQRSLEEGGQEEGSE